MFVHDRRKAALVRRDEGGVSFRGPVARLSGRCAMGCGMALVMRAPVAPLAPFVDRVGYYQSEFHGGRELVLPTGTLALLVNLTGGEALVHRRRPWVRPHRP